MARFTKVVGVTGGSGVTFGAPNKAILLSGANARIAAADMYGNTFEIDHDNRMGSSVFPIRVGEILFAETDGVFLLY